jgi:hypothetical protein
LSRYQHPIRQQKTAWVSKNDDDDRKEVNDDEEEYNEYDEEQDIDDVSAWVTAVRKISNGNGAWWCWLLDMDHVCHTLIDISRELSLTQIVCADEKRPSTC